MVYRCLYRCLSWFMGNDPHQKIRKDEELKSWTMGIRIIHLPKWIPMKQRRSWTMTMPHSRVLTMAPLKSVGNLTCRGYHTFPQVAVGPLVGMSNGIPRGAFHTIHRHTPYIGTNTWIWDVWSTNIERLYCCRPRIPKC